MLNFLRFAIHFTVGFFIGHTAMRLCFPIFVAIFGKWIAILLLITGVYGMCIVASHILQVAFAFASILITRSKET